MSGKEITLFVSIFSLILVGVVSANPVYAMTIDELCDPNQPGAIVAQPGEKNLTGTDGDDILIGNELDNKINGKKGSDVICGGEGNDDLRGGQQNDLLLGQAGSDKFRGGQGIDTCDLSTDDTNERNCELEFGGQDLGGDSFFDIIVEAFGSADNFLNQFKKSDGTFNVDSFFDVFTEISVHEQDIGEIQTELVALDLRGQSCGIGDVVTGIEPDGTLRCVTDQTGTGGSSGMSCENQQAIFDVVPTFIVDEECITTSEADLSISLLCDFLCGGNEPLPLTVGESSQVFVTIGNNGPPTATNVVLHIDWSEQDSDNFFDVSGLGCTPETISNPGHIECSVGDLPIGDGFPVDIEIRALSLPPPIEMYRTISFSLTSDTIDPTPASASLIFDITP